MAHVGNRLILIDDACQIGAGIDKLFPELFRSLPEPIRSIGATKTLSF